VSLWWLLTPAADELQKNPTDREEVQEIYFYRGRPKHYRDCSKDQLQLAKQRVQHLLWTDHVRFAEISDARWAVAGTIGEDIPKASTGLQRRRAKCQCQVVYEQRSVRDADTVVKTDVVTNSILKKHVLQRFSSMKPQVVHVEDRLHALS